MADVERTLVSKALQGGSLSEVVAKGIKPDHFVDPDIREIFEYAMDFHRQYGDPPTVGAVKLEFPKFKPVIDKNPLGYHLDRFDLKVKERVAIDSVRDFVTSIEDPRELKDIELRAFEMARDLAEVLPTPKASYFGRDALKRKHEYHERKKEGKIRGILLGIPSIDEVLLGLKPGQLATIVAYMGVGKSILMAYMAYMAYLQGKTSLMISLEMDASEVMERIDVLASNVRSRALMALELNAGEEQKWYDVLERAHADQHERDIIIRDDIRDCTVDHVFAETSRFKPDLVFVDYLELMSVPRSQGGQSQGWEKVSAAGMGLKQNARLLRIPHVTAAQLNREGGRDRTTLANVSHQSIGKHSDIMLGLQQDEEQEDQQEMEILSLKVRRGPKPHATMRWGLDTMEIHEQGLSERFPKRASLSKKQRALATEVSVRSTTEGKTNPWKKRLGTAKSNPWSAKAKVAA